jgi:hypothetical protein
MAKIWISQHSLGANQDMFMNSLEDFKKFTKELSRFGEVTVYGVSRHYTGMPKTKEYISVDVKNARGEHGYIQAVRAVVSKWQDVFCFNPINIIKSKPKDLRYYEVVR